MRGIALACMLAVPACGTCAGDRAEPAAAPEAAAAERSEERAAMVERQLAARGIADERVLAAMRKVPRHSFMPAERHDFAYRDHPVPIGFDQTISQPYIVAFMTEALALDGSEKVLEIGTGSGYQAAILAELAREVFTIEIVAPLGERARRTLAELGYDNVQVRVGDGYRGWPEQAPFDAVILSAAPDHVPPALLEQLRAGGRMILPLGDAAQELILLEKTAAGLRRRALLPVRFVPMTGEARER